MLSEFKLGNTIANTTKRICSVCREGFVSERTAHKNGLSGLRKAMNR